MNNLTLKDLQDNLHLSETIELFGGAVELIAPSLPDAIEFQIELNNLNSLPENEKAQPFIDLVVKAVMLCLRVEGEPVTEEIAGSLVLRTGLASSPLARSALRLCGCSMMDSDDDEDAQDAQMRKDIADYPF